MGSLRNAQGQACSAPRQRKRWTSSVKTLFGKILPTPRKSSASTTSSKKNESSNSKETLESIENTEPIKRVPTHSSSETVRNDRESANEDLDDDVESARPRDASSDLVTIDSWQLKLSIEENYLPQRQELDDQLQNTYKRLLEIEQEISKGEDFESSIQNRLSMIEEGSEEGGTR